jgi:cytochrome c oxidase accessory protein FixG
VSTAQAPERVLSTLNADGTRRWIRPKFSRGGFWKWRRAVALVLMVIFFIIPYLEFRGKPLVLLDIPRRQFTIFGTTFLPTETLLFMLLFISAGVAIFLATALFGRVWCGWACPQTVYMEFLFRPIEYWLEGGRAGSLTFDRTRPFHWRRVLKWAIYGVLALFLAHTFLAYFVGIDQLAHWVRSSPAHHPTAFFVMALTSVAIFLDFAWFREQTCLVACPYGRLQSVLLDRKSLIVGYDTARGEPRKKPGKGLPVVAGAGDCIDCGACVTTCPTGIDIRDGLQMECIHCTQCMDACDAIMDRVQKPRGLIRYGSRAGFEGLPARMLRPRVILYPAALAVSLGLLAFFLVTRRDAEVTVLRGTGAPYTVQADGRVVNQVRVKVVNRGSDVKAYRIALGGADDAQVIAPENPLTLRAGETRTTSLFVILPRDAFEAGLRHVTFRVSDGAAFTVDTPYDLVGPAGERRDDDGREDREEREGGQ